ncbi:MAG: cytochrome c biogenesis protein CcdA [Bacteroidales bacterium]|nr:cytochrome c biogenesis protein CcdA [Bacteroidales bacterium]
MRRFFLSLIAILSLTVASAQITTTSWSYEQRDNGDGTVDLILKADIISPWYIYSSDSIQKGPLPTTLELKGIKGYEAVGTLRDEGEAVVKHDKAFNIDVKVFHNNAVFIQTIKKLTDSTIVVEGTLSWQTCNGGECLMDETDVRFDIKGLEAAPPAPAKNKSEGLLMFLLIAFAAGLGGVFTPCVFPMIPMTVGFFISGSDNRRKGFMKGLMFGLSVTLIYTLVGILVALFKSTDATDTLGSHWIPNAIFAVLFIVFAISFLGAFEITLPGGLANKADSKADKGGLIASFFVALAMVIVSFSCTGPFVGSILAAAVSGGVAIKPVLGMLVFGLAFSLPFVIFSFFPSLMKKMPKSGGWLNMVKVIFAFILLAFSMKYLSAVDVWFGWGIISRPLVIAVWIAIAVCLGLYLLGKIQTSHDSPITNVGAGRVVFAIVSFSFAIFLIPGLFGAPLSHLSALLPPASETTYTVFNNSALSISDQPGSIQPTNTESGSCAPIKYADPKHAAPYGLQAYYDIVQAVECSKSLKKPVLLAFKSTTCSGCKLMEANVWSDAGVQEILRNQVVLATLYVDDKTILPESEQIVSTLDGKIKNTLGRKNRDYQISRFGIASQPYYVLIDQNEISLVEPVGECSKDDFLNFLNQGIQKFASQSVR